MRKGVVVGTAVGLLGVAAVLVTVPMVSGGTASATPSAELSVEAPEGYCENVTVSATLTGTVHRPVLNLLGLARVTGLEASDISVVGDPSCGEDVEAYETFVRISNGECDEAAQEERHASVCGETGVALHSISATGSVSEQGVFTSYPLGAAWLDGDSWCATVNAGATFQDANGSFTSTDAPAAELCLEAP